MFFGLEPLDPRCLGRFGLWVFLEPGQRPFTHPHKSAWFLVPLSADVANCSRGALGKVHVNLKCIALKLGNPCRVFSLRTEVTLIGFTKLISNPNANKPDYISAGVFTQNFNIVWLILFPSKLAFNPLSVPYYSFSGRGVAEF